MTNTSIPVRRHRVSDRVWSVDAPGIHGTIVAIDRANMRMTVAWDDGTTSVPPYLRIVNEAW